MTSFKYANVAVFRPICSTFEYSIPDRLKKKIAVGSICRTSFRGESVRGVVLDLSGEPNFKGEKKSIKEVTSRTPLPDELLELARWLSRITLTPIGQVLNRFVPTDLSVRPRTKNVVELDTSFEAVRDFIERNERRSPKQVELLEYLLALDEPIEKNELLRKANSSRSPLDSLEEKKLVEISSLPKIKGREKGIVADICHQVDLDIDSGEEPVLKQDLFTQYTVNGTWDRRLATYLKIIGSLAEESTVLILVPNVLRAEEFAGMVEAELDLVALTYHSDLTDGEISSRWNLAFTEDVDVYVGVLSAAYLPISRMKGIIVEGDGDRNYDLTEQDPKGNLVKTARKRAELESVPFVVGGTGPSVESYKQVTGGKLESIDGNFPGGFKKSVDMVLESPEQRYGGRALSAGLKRALKQSFEKQGPALIVGSKTGTSSAAICDECGEVLRCSDCEVPITFTGSGNYGICPYCGSKRNLLVCNNCNSDDIKFIGSGLEKAEAEVRSILPEARVRRFESLEETWEDFLRLVGRVVSGEIDVVLGTSLVESFYLRGRSSLVGLLDLDLVNNRPSYRSTEFLLQRILAGLDLVGSEGKVFLQVREGRGGPFDFVRLRDWIGVYENELESRQRMGYPPFKNLIKIEIEKGKEKEARETANRLKEKLASSDGDFRLLGPTSNKFEKRKSRYRSDLIVKTDEMEVFLDVIYSIGLDGEFGEMRLNPFA